MVQAGDRSNFVPSRGQFDEHCATFGGPGRTEAGFPLVKEARGVEASVGDGGWAQRRARSCGETGREQQRKQHDAESPCFKSRRGPAREADSAV